MAVFKGMSYPMLSAGVLNSLFFGGYGLGLKAIDNIKYGHQVNPDHHRHSKWDIFFAGCSAGAAQLLIACPVDLVKIKLQTQTGSGGAMTTPEARYKGPFDVLKRLYQQEGIRGPYRGLTAMAARYVCICLKVPIELYSNLIPLVVIPL